MSTSPEVHAGRGPVGLLHRHVWQRLPYGLRRALLFRATALLAPRPRGGAPAVRPIAVAGALRAATGLGESARLCLEALRVAGAAPAVVDLTNALQQTDDLSSPVRGPGMQPGDGTVILHVNAPLTGLALLAIGRARAAGKRVVGYWAWELPEVPADWRLGVALVHEIWAPSRFAAAAIARVAGAVPVHVVPHPVAVIDVPPMRPKPVARPFTALCIFDGASSLARKNPEGAVAAFRRAFGDDPGVRLLLKTQRLPARLELAERLRSLAAAPNIELLASSLDSAGLHELYQQADLLLSLHRAEGFGLTIAEAMRRGLPVIATGWSGSADFLSDETGVPIPWRLVPAEDPQRTYHHPHQRWAEPDVEAAAAALRQLRADPERRARIGRAAADFAARHWGAAAYAARLRELGMPV